MVDFAALRDAKPERLAEAVQAWDQRATETRRRADEMRSDVIDVLKGWSSPAAQPAKRKLTSLTNELIDA